MNIFKEIPAFSLGIVRLVMHFLVAVAIAFLIINELIKRNYLLYTEFHAYLIIVVMLVLKFVTVISFHLFNSINILSNNITERLDKNRLIFLKEHLYTESDKDSLYKKRIIDQYYSTYFLKSILWLLSVVCIIVIIFGSFFMLVGELFLGQFTWNSFSKNITNLILPFIYLLILMGVLVILFEYLDKQLSWKNAEEYIAYKIKYQQKTIARLEKKYGETKE